MRSPRGRRRWVAEAALVCLLGPLSACATSEPDIIAVQQTQRPEAGVLNPQTRVIPCRAGDYRGTFTSVPGADASQISALQGSISFSLVEEGSGEFLRVGNNGQKLQGSSEQQATFSADIASDNSGCTAGIFRVNLVNGIYTLDPNASPPRPFDFTGQVDGAYVVTTANDQRFEGFLGAWKAFWSFAPDTPIAQGQWSATLSGFH